MKNSQLLFQGKSFPQIVNGLIGFSLTYIVPFIFTITLVVFLYGSFRFLSASDDEGEREKGRYFMLYGIIGLFVMISIWSLVRILTNTFDIPFGIPQLKTK